MGKAGAFKSISNQDKSITPFKVYKSWRYEDTASIDSANIDRIVAIKPDLRVFSGNKVTLDTWQREEDSGSLLVNTATDKEASIYWYSLNHLYYKRAGQPYETFGYSDPEAIERTLFDEASVISIPQKKFGEAIKPNSVNLRLQNTQLNSISMSLIDDGRGNLVDTALSASIPGELLYLGFNSSTYAKNYFTDLILPSSSIDSELLNVDADFNHSVLAISGSGSGSLWNSNISILYSAESGSFHSSLSTIQVITASNASVNQLNIKLDYMPAVTGSTPNTIGVYLKNNTTATWWYSSIHKNVITAPSGYPLVLTGNTNSTLDVDLTSNGWTDITGMLTGPTPTLSSNFTFINFYTLNSYIANQVNTRNVIDNIHVDTLYNDVTVTGKNVHIIPNSETYTNTTTWGNAAFLSNKGYIRIRNREEFNFKRSDDYAISFWINQFATSSLETYILSKKSTGIGNYKDKQTGKIITGDVEYSVTQFPYEIVYAKNTNKLTCRISNGADTSKLEYSNNVTGSVNHIVFQKTGSLIELYVDSTKIGSTSIPADGNFQNDADIFIGSYGIDSNQDGRFGIQATIDEFFIFNKGLTQKEITQLAFTGSENTMITNTNNVGNVFYEHGIIVLSDPRPKYGTKQYKMFNDRVYNYISGATEPGLLSKFYLGYNSTVTLYEHEYVCKLKEDEFNFTSNPTIRKDNDLNSEFPKDFVAGASFSPYITTVGLYDQYGRLLAVGKLGTPIKKRDNVDLAIIVKFDM